MNKLQKKKSRFITKYYKEYLGLCKKYGMKEPSYSQMKMYFNRTIKRFKEDEKLRGRIDL